MKKILVLIVSLFLAACGGGGSAQDGSNGAATGSLSINFVDGSAAAKTVALQTYTDARIAITNANVNGAAFKVVQDQPKGSAFEFALPVAGGYTVEAITYNTVGGVKVPADYAIAKNVTISATVPATVSLDLKPAAAKLTAPGVAVQGARFSVLANLSSAGGRSVTPLQTAWFMPTPQTTPFSELADPATAVYAATHPVTAPLVGQDGTKLYFQGVFTLKPSLLKAGESNKTWAFHSPLVGFGNVSTAILAPTNVTINLPQ